ncbi:uncharacterized protein LOC133205931 [Saccostrea echinata]|uniref:uncharacterized protein LOC133205931 n=1 Tax=Saccostrea echinata TaxID=191078 RepID=UPI002A7F83B9|nr:uncharacterized protein LOC133205931 [Saccostrea echinata]
MRKFSFLSPSQSLKWICLIILTFLVLELLLFNCFIFYGLGVLHRTFGPLLNIGDVDWKEDLKQARWVRELVYRGKAGGFVSLLQDTVERVYMIEGGGSEGKKIKTFGIDVSHSGEFLYIYKHILARRHFPYARLVVDIGANDGLLSSNSFNFIQMGWSALLVEPQASQAEMAAKNVVRYVNPYRDNNQTVKVIKNVISNKSGVVSFLRRSDIADMEGHIAEEEVFYPDNPPEGDIIQVVSITVKRFTSKYNVPKYFGVLSIDAEGTGNQILHSFIDLGFRPGYIIYEDLHERAFELPDLTEKYLNENGYRLLSRRGWNLIFCHQARK